MTSLKARIKYGLDESRILILGAQVLLGFQFQAVLQKGFDALPVATQYLKIGGLVLLLVAVALLMAPAPYHQIGTKGKDTRDLHRFITTVTTLALFPFATSLAIDLYAASEKVMGMVPGIIVGVVALLVALFFWYGLEVMQARRGNDGSPAPREEKQMKDEQEQSGSDGEKLKDEVDQVLTETRVVLPGAQALLGFQFAGILMESFDKLPASSKYVHLASLVLIALSTILLVTPAAYHRIVEHGEETERFKRFASRMLLAAMVPLALGISSEFYVVVSKVLQSDAVALVAAILMLVLFYGFWFGFTAYRRAQRGT